jgi:hypothetical protein
LRISGASKVAVFLDSGLPNKHQHDNGCLEPTELPCDGLPQVLQQVEAIGDVLPLN